jgi:hypothetical protein
MDKENLVDGGFLDASCPECKMVMFRHDCRTILECRNSSCGLFGVRWKRPSIKLERVPESYTDADVAMALRMVLDFPVSSSLGLCAPLCEGEPLPPEDGLGFAVTVLQWHLRQIEARMNGGER